MASGYTMTPYYCQQDYGKKTVKRYAGGGLVTGLTDDTGEYGATPVLAFSGGTPKSGTMIRSLANMAQAKLLKKALKK
jgi:hypothetical protein